MIIIELLSVIRRWRQREHFSIREILRRTGLSRNTVRKYLRADSVEPRFNVHDRASKLDPYADKLSHILRQETGKSSCYPLVLHFRKTLESFALYLVINSNYAEPGGIAQKYRDLVICDTKYRMISSSSLDISCERFEKKPFEKGGRVTLATDARIV